jgi:hypothetical protein
MNRANATVATVNASRYLQQLCKHFAHKIPVAYDAEKGRADFPWGVCHFEARDGALAIRAEAETPEGIARVTAVVDDHLTRFAWRENLALEWTRRNAPA